MKKTEFEKGLEILLEKLQGEMKELKKLSPSEFEEHVHEIIIKIFNNVEIIYEKGGKQFPDIAIPPFGIEIKFTEKDSWSSTGNSILENTRVPNVEKIYMCFFKAGGEPGIRIRPYEEVLTEIVVTHSPRYRIDMNATTTIFEKMEIGYDEFRQSNPIGKAKDYYRKYIKRKGGALWWVDENKDENVIPVLRHYKDLSREEKEKLKCELIALFPEVLNQSSSGAKYDNAALYLISKHNVVNRSFRDMFSAGGKEKLTINEKEIEVSRAIYQLYSYANQIKELIEKLDAETVQDCWGVDVSNKSAQERVELYKNILDVRIKCIEGEKASIIFSQGINS